MDAAGYPEETGFVSGKSIELGEAVLVFGRTRAFGGRSLGRRMPFGSVSKVADPGRPSAGRATVHLPGDADGVRALPRDHLADHPDSAPVAPIAASATPTDPGPERGELA